MERSWKNQVILLSGVCMNLMHSLSLRLLKLMESCNYIDLKTKRDKFFMYPTGDVQFSLVPTVHVNSFMCYTSPQFSSRKPAAP